MIDIVKFFGSSMDPKILINQLESGNQIRLIDAIMLEQIENPLIKRAANLYLQKYEDNPQIDLFNLLATKVPQVTLIAKIANDILCSHFKKTSPETLIDIGIGSGRQVCEILSKISKARSNKLTIIGIEPNADILDSAEKNIMTIAKELPFEVEFTPICSLIEKLSAKDWINLKSPNLVINASFALHHIGYSYCRQEIFDKIRSLSPSLFVLSEPNVDHQEANFSIRARSCYQHFSKTFESIDALDISDDEKYCLKKHFFGREIKDILQKNEKLRTERHEPTETWIQYLSEAGFQPHHHPGEYDSKELKIKKDNWSYRLELDDFPLTSVIYCQS